MLPGSKLVPGAPAVPVRRCVREPLRTTLRASAGKNSPTRRRSWSAFRKTSPRSRRAAVRNDGASARGRAASDVTVRRQSSDCKRSSDRRRAFRGRTRVDARRAREAGRGRALPAGGAAAGRRRVARPSERAALLFDAVRLFPRVECAGEGSAIVSGATSICAGSRISSASTWRSTGRRDEPRRPLRDRRLLRGDPAWRRAIARADVDRGRRVRDPSTTHAWFPDSSTRGAAASCRESRAFAWPRTGPHWRTSSSARAACRWAPHDWLSAVLPHCLCADAGLELDVRASVESAEGDGTAFGVAFGRRVEYAPCGSDPVGAFASCGNDGNACTDVGCPGTAIGWQRNTRSERWMQDS